MLLSAENVGPAGRRGPPARRRSGPSRSRRSGCSSTSPCASAPCPSASARSSPRSTTSLITVGLLALFGREFNLVVVAALLTLVGYSVNDTVVVYDRIRENQRTPEEGAARDRHQPLDQPDALADGPDLGRHDARRRRALRPGRRGSEHLRADAHHRHHHRDVLLDLRRRRRSSSSGRTSPRGAAASASRSRSCRRRPSPHSRRPLRSPPKRRPGRRRRRTGGRASGAAGRLRALGAIGVISSRGDDSLRGHPREGRRPTTRRATRTCCGGPTSSRRGSTGARSAARASPTSSTR